MTTTELKGNVKLCEDTGAVLTVNKPITIGTGFTYSYSGSIMPNEIGARVDNGGTGGAPLTVTGDGLWRNYLYVNNVPKGIYLFQYWCNNGGATYSNVQTAIYQSATAFTTTGGTISTPPTNQLYPNIILNLVNSATPQTSFPHPVYIDSATPNVAFALKCNTNINPATYHGLMLWRIA